MKKGLTYQLDDKSNWDENADYQKTGGRLTRLSPNAFLNKVEPLGKSKKDKKAVKKFKKQIKAGKKSDPAAIYPEGGQDGRHHAKAAKELAIKSIPVITWSDKATGGSITDSALMLLSKKANCRRGRPE